MKNKKYNRLAVFIEDGEGEMRQALLDKNEMRCVADLLVQLHGGEIKVIDNVFDSLYFEKHEK